jgi:putative transposase
MDEYESSSHTRRECEYHVVFIPKSRGKTLYGKLRRNPERCFTSWPSRRRAGSRKGAR